MRYEILVEGGFTGIPKKYEGEVTLNSKEKTELFDLMMDSAPSNKKLRDGLKYKVTLIDSDKTLEATFGDANLPKAIRDVLNR